LGVNDLYPILEITLALMKTLAHLTYRLYRKCQILQSRIYKISIGNMFCNLYSLWISKI